MLYYVNREIFRLGVHVRLHGLEIAQWFRNAIVNENCNYLESLGLDGVHTLDDLHLGVGGADEQREEDDADQTLSRHKKKIQSQNLFFRILSSFFIYCYVLCYHQTAKHFVITLEIHCYYIGDLSHIPILLLPSFSCPSFHNNLSFRGISF